MKKLKDLYELTEKLAIEIKQMGILLQALELMPNPIVLTDVTGKIIWVNTAFLKNTSFPKEKVIGNNPRILKSGQHDASFYKNMWEKILNGKIWQGFIINKHSDGKLKKELTTIVPIMQNNKIEYFLGVKQLTDDEQLLLS